MRLREVVFQGVFGLQRPARVRIDEGFCSLNLPPGASPEAFRNIILSLLYPREVSASTLRGMVNEQGGEVRLGCVVERVAAQDGERAQVYKVYRRLDAISVGLQSLSEPDRGRELARGADEVQRHLQGALSLPGYQDFRLLNCWDQPAVATSPARSVSRKAARVKDSPELQRLIELYAIATGRETFELDIDTLEADLAQERRKYTRLTKLMSKVEGRRQRVEQLEETLGLSDQNKIFLRDYKKTDKDFQARLESLTTEVETSREREEEHRPVPLSRELPVMIGLGASALVLVISAVVGVRMLALLNIILMGVAAWAMLRRYDRLEAASVFNIRVEQIYRHIETTKQERVDTTRRWKGLLTRIGLSDDDSIDDLEEELEELRAKQVKNKDDEVELRMGESQATLDGLQSKIAELEAARDAVGECHVPTYEIESQLERYDIDAATARTLIEGDASPQGDEASEEAQRGPMGIFKILQQRAESMAMFRSGSLRTRPRAAWKKMLTHVLGDRWGEVNLIEGQGLVIGDSLPADVAQELSDNPVMLRVVSGLLSAAMLASLPDDDPRSRFLCLTSPYGQLDERQGRRLDKILEFLGNSAHVLVLEQHGDPMS